MRVSRSTFLKDNSNSTLFKIKLLKIYLITVFPSSMAKNRYVFSAPAPAEDGLTTVYFLPESDEMKINVIGEIDQEPFNQSFTPKVSLTTINYHCRAN